MTLEVRRFRPEDGPAIDRLNARLAAGGIDHRVHAEPAVPKEHGSRRHRMFIAATPLEVHGGVGLVEQTFRVGGRSIRAGWIKYPVAESLVDPSYSGVPGGLLFQLMREQPHLMALGMGGHAGPLARVLATMRWPGTEVPFYFSILKPARVFRRLRHLRSTAGRRLALDFLAVTGLGWLGVRSATWLRAPFPSASLRGVTTETVDAFGPWADAIWQEHQDAYGFVAQRDQQILNELYPLSFEGLSRLRIERAGKDVGWAAVLRMDLRDRPTARYFGRLAVGVVADGFAAPADATAVVAAAVRHLRSQDVDLIISNQSHPAWGKALTQAGFFRGPSNFAFYHSPALNALLESPAVEKKGILLNRGDCDGPKWI